MIKRSDTHARSPENKQSGKHWSDIDNLINNRAKLVISWLDPIYDKESELQIDTVTYKTII